jgi:hypothetical protein
VGLGNGIKCPRTKNPPKGARPCGGFIFDPFETPLHLPNLPILGDVLGSLIFNLFYRINSSQILREMSIELEGPAQWVCH